MACGNAADTSHEKRVLPAMASNEQPNNAHRSTYESFTSFTKWGTVTIVMIVLALFVFLV
jgi:hypothetical protein